MTWWLLAYSAWLRGSLAPWLDRISGTGGTSATLREELAALRFRKPTDAPRRMYFGPGNAHAMCQDLAKSLPNTGLKSVKFTNILHDLKNFGCLKRPSSQNGGITESNHRKMTLGT